jgi:hypothetical protein
VGVGTQLVKGQQAGDKQEHALGKGGADGSDGGAGRQVEHGVGYFEHAEGLPHEQGRACGYS